MAARPHVTFVVVAGGRGERLWPLVRANRPKVCLSVNGRTLLGATIARLRGAWPGAEWMVITVPGQARAVRAALPRELRHALIVEPEPKNTAACIGLASSLVHARDPERLLVVVPADHWIPDEGAFRASVRAALAAARQSRRLVVIGLPASRREAGLGHLGTGAAWGRRHGVRIVRLARFIEKPSRAAAARLFAQGRVFWNVGLFIGTADAFQEAIGQHLPGHARRLSGLSRRGGAAAWRRAYAGLEAVSFDHGVMTHARDALLVEGRFRWADMGSWHTWPQFGVNAARTLIVGGRNVRAVSEQPHLVAAIGVHNLLVVHTPDATLICPPARAQQVRQLLRRLGRSHRLAAYQ